MPFYLLDILKLKPGKTVEDAAQYFDELAPIFAEVGIERVDQPLKVGSVMRGPLNAEFVNIFKMEDPKSAMGAMQSHADYQVKIPVRDATFDLENSAVLVTTKM